jgi:hypothetical protein
MAKTVYTLKEHYRKMYRQRKIRQAVSATANLEVR